EELVARGDVLDRAISLHLPPISPARRQTEAAFWAAFTHARPALLGGLLDALVGTLAVLPSVRLRELPRLADFARFGVAVERALGWPPGPSCWPTGRTGRLPMTWPARPASSPAPCNTSLRRWVCGRAPRPTCSTRSRQRSRSTSAGSGSGRTRRRCWAGSSAGSRRRCGP